MPNIEYVTSTLIPPVMKLQPALHLRTSWDDHSFHMKQNFRFFNFQDWTEALWTNPSEAALVAQVPADPSHKDDLPPPGSLVREARVRFPILFSTTPWQTTLLGITQRTALWVPIAGFEYDY